jgi:hypothetical protein
MKISIKEYRIILEEINLYYKTMGKIILVFL